MSNKYAKELTSNDVGKTGGHQGGICVPKKMKGLLSFLPALSSNDYNPREIIHCVDTNGKIWDMQYIHYNNKIVKHPETGKYGTRNEYRITHMTKLFKEYNAEEGDTVEFEEIIPNKKYRINFIRKATPSLGSVIGSAYTDDDDEVIPVITLKGWRRYSI